MFSVEGTSCVRIYESGRSQSNVLMGFSHCIEVSRDKSDAESFALPLFVLIFRPRIIISLIIRVLLYHRDNNIKL